MTISYKWLSEYLPVTVEPERLSKILTSIGLEVESLSLYEEIKGGLIGLVIGEVMSTEKHPNADKLTLTQVNIGGQAPLSIVCGAPNVAAGQKVIVAPVGRASAIASWRAAAALARKSVATTRARRACMNVTLGARALDRCGTSVGSRPGASNPR